MQLLVRDIGSAHLASIDSTSFECCIIEEFFKDSVDRLRCYRFATQWTVFVFICQPSMNALSAEDMVTAIALCRVVYQQLADATLEVLWHITIFIGSCLKRVLDNLITYLQRIKEIYLLLGWLFWY